MDAADFDAGPAQYLSLDVHKTRSATLIQLSGDLDLGSVHHLEDCLSIVLAEGDGRPIHLDMGAVSFVDCVGFRPLIRAAAGLENGQVMKITSASARVRRLIELMSDIGIPIDGGIPISS